MLCPLHSKWLISGKSERFKGSSSTRSLMGGVRSLMGGVDLMDCVQSSIGAVRSLMIAVRSLMDSVLLSFKCVTVFVKCAQGKQTLTVCRFVLFVIFGIPTASQQSQPTASNTADTISCVTMR